MDRKIGVTLVRDCVQIINFRMYRNSFNIFYSTRSKLASHLLGLCLGWFVAFTLVKPWFFCGWLTVYAVVIELKTELKNCCPSLLFSETLFDLKCHCLTFCCFVFIILCLAKKCEKFFDSKSTIECNNAANSLRLSVAFGITAVVSRQTTWPNTRFYRVLMWRYL